MKLIDDFFHITETTSQDGLLTCNIALNPEHYIYGVHFPGNPVTPGVFLLQMATEILEHHYGKRLKLDTAVNIRFKNPVLPQDELVYEFTKISFEDNQTKVRLIVKNEMRQFLSMSLKYNMIG